MQKFLAHLELLLTVAGVLVVVAVFAIFRNIAPWKAAAISALAVGVLHGIIFYVVRSAQRRARIVELRSIRNKLNDLIRNKLQVVLFASACEADEWRGAAQLAVKEIEVGLARIELETLSAAKH
jgi:hypothetical protein